jgi:hypothetical protein
MLRPEKSWRPIITLKVDDHHKYEVMLGTDGQNPNQRDVMLLCVAFRRHFVNGTDPHSHRVHHQTCITLDVWYKSQSKAKSRKRRQHIASAAMPLGEVMKKQGTDPCAPPLALLFSTCDAHATFRRGASPVRCPCCTKKVCSSKTPTLRFSPHPFAATAAPRVSSEKTLA